MNRFFLFLTLTSAGFGAAAPTQGTGTSGPEYPSAFTNYLINTVVPGYQADESAPGATDLEISYLRGEVDGTNFAANIVGQYPAWTTDFGAKENLEQVQLEPIEMQIVLFTLFGTDPSTDTYHYWQGYEDAIQDTLDSMNSWPGTGGTVTGTTVEYELVLPGNFGTDPSAATPTPTVTPAPAVSTPTIAKAPTVIMSMPSVNSSASANARSIPARRSISASLFR